MVCMASEGNAVSHRSVTAAIKRVRVSPDAPSFSPPVELTGWITETITALPFGGFSFTLRLDGPGPYFLVADVHYLTGQDPQPGDAVSIGPWAVRYVGYSLRHLAQVVVLDTPPNRLRHWWYLRRRQLRDVLSRCVLTLYVWGLAERHPHGEPDLRDVPALRPLLDWRDDPHPWWPGGHAWQT